MKTAKGTELPIIQLKGKDYLQVAHRLVWFREEKPEWSIETEFLQITDLHSIAKATIRNEQGRIIATGHKREDAKHFADHNEKSETGAIGRALALCGFGTQFAPDLDEEHRIVDSPVVKPVYLKTVKPETPKEETIGDYKITFGKWKGHCLSYIGLDGKDGLLEYVSYIEKKASQDGKPITGQVAEFIGAVKAYAETLNEEDNIKF